MRLTGLTVMGISVVIGLLTVLVTWHIDSKDTRKRFALVAGILMLILGGLAELRVETVFEAAEFRRLVAAAIPTVSSKPLDNVVRTIARYDARNDAAPEMAEFYAKLDEPLARRMQEIIDRAEGGSIEISFMSDAMALIQDLMRSAKDSIFASSYVAPAVWWSTIPGTQYDSVARSLGRSLRRFRRIFIYETAGERDSVSRVARGQRSAGIEARLASAMETDRDNLRGFIVIDGVVGATLNLDERRRFKSAVFFASTTRAKELGIVFRRLHQASEWP